MGLVGTFLWLSMLAAPWKLGGGLLDAADHFARAQKKLTAGAIKDARFETLAGVAAAQRARSGLDSDSPLLDLATMTPKVEGVLQEAPHFVEAAILSGRAAAGTLDIAQNALRGPDKIIAKDPEDPKGGAQIRIDRIEDIAATIKDVHQAISGVDRELRAVRLQQIPRRLRPKVTQGIEQASETEELLGKAEAGLAILPRFLGADGQRIYLFGMQNSAEQRGTGGAMLQFALLSITDGRPELSEDASTVYDVDKDRTPISIPLPEDAWYVREISDAQRFGNANWSPDWPLSAQLTIDYARASEPTFPEQIDGVFAVTPITMQKLLPGVGPYRIPTGNRISAKKVVHFLLYKAYASFPIPKVRRARLREVVDGFYERLLRPDHPSEIVKGFGASLAEKQMQIWMADPTEQAFIKEMEWDGGLDTARGSDYINVVEQNVGGNKLDYFSEQRTSVDVRIEGADAHVSTNISVRNGVFLPQPRWSMGDSGPDHHPMMNIYVQGDAQLQSASVEGTRLDTAAAGLAAWPAEDRPAEHFELGKKVWSTVLQIPPQETASVSVDYLVPGVVREADGRSTYRLVVQHQPKLRPDELRVRLQLPEDALGISAPGWKKQDGTLVYERPLKADMILEVSWRT
ncbi:MAG TPA: DUF4012 domain-containing protein [Actinomycetota bacterium]|nr:DUF4012 domain-containing protein [Actinomycetota bacterium]